jgi:hypothetical protein
MAHLTFCSQFGRAVTSIRARIYVQKYFQQNVLRPWSESIQFAMSDSAEQREGRPR